MSEAPLDPNEDAELRRLNVLAEFGMVAGSVTSRYDDLRGRDRRHGIRDPDESQIAVPTERNLWGELQAPQRAPKSVERVESHLADSHPVESHSVESRPAEPHIGEYFGSRPETRRGRGLFRR